ncbi:MAG: hypothetical protein HY282_08870 [Nitrospirae bacterium]|nr:hypothetical protein [Candidatus Manganitrophaceae bacterium]
MKKQLLKGFLILATISQVGYAGYGFAADGPGAPPERINGTIERIDDHAIAVRTDSGAVMSYPISKSRRDDFSSYTQGEKVVVERTWANRSINVFPATVISANQGYRTIHGKVQTFSPSDERLTVVTHNGETETFTVKGPAIQKMNSIREGSRVTVEVDDQNRVVGIHKG